MEIVIRLPAPRTMLVWAVAVAIVAALGSVLIVRGWPSDARAASGNDWSISIDVDGDTVADCDTRTGGPGAKCSVALSGGFTVQASIDKLAMPNKDGDAKAGYLGFSSRFDYSSGLTLKNRTGFNEILWGGCAIPLESKMSGMYAAACTYDTGQNESTQTGVIVEVDFNCGASISSETVALVHGLGGVDTQMVTENFTALSDDPDAPSETLTINCETVGPTPTPGPGEINVASLGQYALPKSCFDVSDDQQTFLFTVCDNDFQGAPDTHTVCDADATSDCEDADATLGSVRVAVDDGDYHVEVSKVPLNHSADATKAACSVGPKCELTFTNSSQASPWFPWDVHGPGQSWPPDGYVDLPNDILPVILHWQQSKP